MALTAPPGSAGHADVFRTVVDVLEHGILLVDGSGTVLASNPSAERILGFEAPRVCGGSDVPWTFTDEAGAPVAAEDLPCQRSLRTGEEQTGVVLGVNRSDGDFAWVEFNARPTVNGVTPVAVLSLTDVTERRLEGERLRALAERDSLTGVYNRRHLEEQLRLQVTRCRQQGEMAVLALVDLDGLKDVNDTLGHAAGDALLRDAAGRLSSQLRGGDLLARIGGDEFAVLLTGVDAVQGQEIAERLAAVLSEPRTLDKPTPVASIGVCALDEAVAGSADVLAAADAALYAAKRVGGGAVRSSQAAAAQHRWRAPRTTLQVFERLGADHHAVTVERIVAAARDLLDMDLAYTTHHTDAEQVFEVLNGDGASFGVDATTRMPLEATYCHRILAGDLPPVMADLRAIPEAAAMPVTEAAGVGAYVSVPVLYADGELHGTLCCAAHDARPDLSERDLRYLQLLAKLLGDHMDRDRRQAEREQLRAASSGIRALAAAVEARDQYTSEHSEGVVELVGRVARSMGLDAREIETAEQVALLHDLGKLAIPDAILHKPGPLDDAEWEIMRTHPEAGARLVAAVPELEHLADAIRAEHERWDGQGYPLGLAGEAIPVASRIAFVCDAYHAMTSDRPYREALPREHALDEIAACAGTQFCPESARALIVALSDA